MKNDNDDLDGCPTFDEILHAMDHMTAAEYAEFCNPQRIQAAIDKNIKRKLMDKLLNKLPQHIKSTIN